MDVGHGGQGTPFGLVDAMTGQHGGELGTILCVVDVLCLGAKDGHMLLIEAHGEVVGYLSAGGDDDAIGLFQFDDVHNALEGEFVKVEPVAHVIVGGDGLGVVVDHD